MKKYLVIVLILILLLFICCFLICKKIKNHNITDIKVSVIVPVYNGEQYISKQSKCLFRQTLRDIEIIYVNDGSTDNTRNMLEKLQKRHKNIILINQENKGPGNARNAGFRVAKGEYVIFLDVDDTYDKDMLSIMYKEAKNTNSDIVICNSKERYMNKVYNNTMIRTNLLPDKKVFNRKDIPSDIMYITGAAVWNKLYRRQFLVDNNIIFPDLNNNEDLAFCCLSLALAERITVVNDALITYSCSNSNNVSSRMNDTPESVIKSLRILRKNLISRGLYDELKQNYFMICIGSFLYAYYNVNDNAKKLLVKSSIDFFEEIKFFSQDIKNVEYKNFYIEVKDIVNNYKNQIHN